MGKSSKKTKSDRINALRKQYDAFLDEDKKRKDRNEFILGRLENMRMYTPAVVPVRHNMGNPQINKYHFVTQERPDYLKKIRFEDSAVLPSRQTDLLPNRVTKDEQIILQEISKKYILIPKLRPTNDSNLPYYNSLNASNDADWRNKYNILDELKQIEKEGPSEMSKENPDIKEENNNHKLHLVNPENINEPIDNIRDSTHNVRNNNDDNPGISELKANKIKTVPTDGPCYDTDHEILLESKKDMIPTTVNIADHINDVPPDLDCVNHDKFTSDSNKIDEQLNPHENVTIVEQRNENKDEEKLNLNQSDTQPNEMKMVDKIATIILDTQEIHEPVIQNDSIDQSNAEIVDTRYVPPLNGTNEILAIAQESAQNQELCGTVDSEPISKNDHQQVYEPNNEATIISDDVHPLQNDGFEVEQKEIFYSEEAGYNQNVDNAEYSQNEEYTNEQYSYYTESQQEQPYCAEINEHEESTERYDPSYEQQYVQNYEENINVAPYENQQYGLDSYENNQEGTNVNYEQQPVEQQLINANYDQQSAEQQEVANVNYEPQLDEQMINVNYEQQSASYEYDYSGHTDNPDQGHIENTYESQASENVGYETQQYNEVGDVEHPIVPEQNIYESQQEYVQMQEQETLENVDQPIDREDYTELKNNFPHEFSTEVENANQIESNINVK